MRIVILDGGTITQNDLSWASLEKMGQLEVHSRTPQEQITATIGDAPAVCLSKCRMTAEVMDACPGLKFIGTLATGYDNVDIDAARKRGIAVCNIPAYSTDAVAQHTFALLLEITNQVGLHNQAVQDGEWSRSADFCMMKSPILQLAGRSIGIIGYGNIGRRVGAIAEAFGMQVFVYSRNPEEAVTADVVTLHCPVTAENRGFVNRQFFSRMKDGAILLNTARGALISEPDLAEALCSGKLAAAGVDVLNGEPPAPGHPLFGIPNLFITPHIAWASREARSTICEVSAQNLKSFLEGGRLNRVDL